MYFNKANLSYDFCYGVHKVSLKIFLLKKYNVHVNKKRRKQKEKKKVVICSSAKHWKDPASFEL